MSQLTLQDVEDNARREAKDIQEDTMNGYLRNYPELLDDIMRVVSRDLIIHINKGIREGRYADVKYIPEEK